MVKFSSILIGTRNLHAAKEFYEKFFEVEFDEFRPPFASFTFDDIEFNLEEDTSYRNPDWAKMYIGGRKPFSFSVDSLDNLTQRLVLLGGRVVQKAEEKPWGYIEAVVADLDGNEFILEQEIQK